MIMSNKPGNNNRLKAFTLFELMIGLTITSIVIIVTILAYSIINKQFIRYQRQSEEIRQIYQGGNALENDLSKHKILNIDPQEFRLYSAIDTLKYQYSEDGIYRINQKLNDSTLFSGLRILSHKTIENYNLIEYKIVFEFDSIQSRIHY